MEQPKRPGQDLGAPLEIEPEQAMPLEGAARRAQGVRAPDDSEGEETAEAPAAARTLDPVAAMEHPPAAPVSEAERILQRSREQESRGASQSSEP